MSAAQSASFEASHDHFMKNPKTTALTMTIWFGSMAFFVCFSALFADEAFARRYGRASSSGLLSGAAPI